VKLLLKFALIALGFWVQAAVAGPALRVDRPQVNVRADATVQAVRIGVLRSGELVEKIGSKNEWNQIRLSDGRLGWLHSDLVQELWVVERERVRVREAGSTTAATVALVERGKELVKLREQGNWFEVEMEDGRRGWIWKELVAARAIDLDVGEAPPENSVQVVAIEEEEADTTNDIAPEIEEDSAEESGGVVLRNPYAEGLQREKDGDYRQALDSFEEVLAQDPDHLRALIHAIKADKELGQYESGLERLYHAVELSGGRRDIYMSLAEMYGLVGQPDSVAKYEALFRGEVWQPRPEEEGAITETEVEAWWVYVAIVLASAFLFVIAIAIFIKRGKKEKSRERGETKFARAMGQASPQNTPKGGGEERELDRQIGEKREALRESASAFLGATGGDADEDELMEGLLGQLDTFRRALEAQDERARVYAELVRLQNAKIETMEREVQLLKKRRKS